jgi:hypothetical protein
VAITIEIKPDTRAELSSRAAAVGVGLETYAASLLDNAVADMSAPLVNEREHAEAKELGGLGTAIAERFRGIGFPGGVPELRNPMHLERTLGDGRGSVTFLSVDWNKPMSDEEADAFWEGRW